MSSESEEENDVGPPIPEGFYERQEVRRGGEEDGESVLLGSYRRPKKQVVVPTVVHPMDEKKIQVELNFKEQQRKEVLIRAEMRRLLDDTRKRTAAD